MEPGTCGALPAHLGAAQHSRQSRISSRGGRAGEPVLSRQRAPGGPARKKFSASVAAQDWPSRAGISEGPLWVLDVSDELNDLVLLFAQLLLQAAEQLIFLSYRLGEIVVGEQRVVLLELPLHFVPFTLECQLVHGPLSFLNTSA